MPLLTHGVESATSMKLTFGRSLLVGLLAEAYLLAGRVRDASELGARALDLALAHGERGYEAWTLRLLGEIAAHGASPGVDSAVHAFWRETRLATELGMRPLVAHCRFGLGRLYRRVGQLDQANEHLTSATAMYREMDMPFWLNQSEAALAAAERCSIFDVSTLSIMTSRACFAASPAWNASVSLTRPGSWPE